jgi:hypothetical protein
MTVHRCPVRGEGLTPCCGKALTELPLDDRVALANEDVTCGTPNRPYRSEPSVGYPGRVVFDCPNGWYVSAIPQSQHTWEAFAFDNKGVLRLEVTGGVDHYDLTGEEVERMVDLAAEQEMVL